MEPTSTIGILQTAGVLGGLVLLLVALMARKLVFGWQYDAKVKESEEWKAMALAGTSLAARATSTAEQVIPRDDRLARIEEILNSMAGKSGP